MRVTAAGSLPGTDFRGALSAMAEALPEVVDQGFSALLDHVYRTGRAHVGRGVSFEFRRTPEGPLEQRIIDFTYQPLANRAGRVQDIFVQLVRTEP